MGRGQILPALSLTFLLQSKWKSLAHKIFWLFLRWSKGSRFDFFLWLLDFFDPSPIKLCHKMQWVWPKFIFNVATKFCSKVTNLFLLPKKPSTHKWQHCLTFCTKFCKKIFCSYLKFCYICIEICLSLYIMLQLSLVAKATNRTLLLQ